MTYKEYPYIDKVYILHHTEGIGVMESPLYEREIIAASDDKKELEEIGRKTYPSDGSGWDYHKWCINVNTSTEGGKVLLEKFHDKVAHIQTEIDEHPEDYSTIEVDGQKWTTAKCILDSSKEAQIDEQIRERKEQIRNEFKKQFPQYRDLYGEELERALEKEDWNTPISDMKNPSPLTSIKFIVFDVSDKTTENEQ